MFYDTNMLLQAVGHLWMFSHWFIHLLLFNFLNFTCLHKKSMASLIQSNPKPISLTFSVPKDNQGFLPGLLCPFGLLPQTCCKDVKLRVPLDFTVSFLSANNYNGTDVVQIFWANFRYNYYLFCFVIPASHRVGQIQSRFILTRAFVQASPCDNIGQKFPGWLLVT